MTRPGARRGRSATLSAIGALAVVMLFPSAAVAAFPGGNGRIAYPGFAVDGSQAILTVRPDGSGVQQLTFPGCQGACDVDTAPSWSADGRRLVFVRMHFTIKGNTFAISTINADGEDLTRVGTAEGTDPSLSPSGREIVYALGGSMFTVNSDGTEEREVLSGAYLADPEYSPSGKRIVFAGRREDHPQGRTAIWSVRPDGSHLRQLTDGAAGVVGDDYDPDYSPDGGRIVFGRAEDSGTVGSELHVMRADGSHEHPIGGTEGAQGPAYAPAGDRIAMALRGPSGVGHLFTISPSGSDREELTAAGTAYSTSWQPNPPSTFSFEEVKQDKERGTATLGVGVPGPGDLRVERTKKVRAASERTEAEGEVTLPVRPRGKARKKLEEKGKAKVKAEVSFNPDGAGPNTRSKRIKLKKRNN